MPTKGLFTNNMHIWHTSFGRTASLQIFCAASCTARFAPRIAPRIASQIRRPNAQLIHEQALTSMFNKNTPKHETRVPCVGRVSTRHGRLKSALRHAILVGCGRCFRLMRAVHWAIACPSRIAPPGCQAGLNCSGPCGNSMTTVEPSRKRPISSPCLNSMHSFS